MQKDSTLHPSLSTDVQEQEQTTNNLKPTKKYPSWEETAEIIAQQNRIMHNGHEGFTKNKRQTARYEHSNHFTNRAKSLYKKKVTTE